MLQDTTEKLNPQEALWDDPYRRPKSMLRTGCYEPAGLLVLTLSAQCNFDQTEF